MHPQQEEKKYEEPDKKFVVFFYMNRYLRGKIFKSSDYIISEKGNANIVLLTKRSYDASVKCLFSE